MRENTVTYVKGDATKPSGDGVKIVVHVVNNFRLWGAGFVLALSRRWPKAEEAYRNSQTAELVLGNVQFVQVEPDVIVANMVAQHGIMKMGEVPPIRYERLGVCLDKVAEKALELGASVHGPRFGAGLAGGKWDKIEKIITDTLVAKGIPVTIYDL
jgi:O-acetyl-ADP-ribose deacetylase (regulator of RNase III)